MLLPVFFDDGSDLSDNWDSAVANIFLFVVEKVIKQREDSATDLLVAHFTEVLSNQSHKGRELVEQCFFDISVLVIGELLQGGKQDVDLAFVSLVGESYQVVREVQALALVVTFYQLEYLCRTQDLLMTVLIFLVSLIIQLKQVVNLSMRLFFLFLSQGSFFKFFENAIGVFGLSGKHIVIDQSVVEFPVLLTDHNVKAGLIICLLLLFLVKQESVYLSHVKFVNIVASESLRVDHVRVVGWLRSFVAYSK